MGWTFVSSEVYGEPTVSSVFCSAACVSAVTADPAEAVDFGFAKKVVPAA